MPCWMPGGIHRPISIANTFDGDPMPSAFFAPSTMLRSARVIWLIALCTIDSSPFTMPCNRSRPAWYSQEPAPLTAPMMLGPRLRNHDITALNPEMVAFLAVFQADTKALPTAGPIPTMNDQIFGPTLANHAITEL